MQLMDKFTHGKHKGLTLDKVLNLSPTYITWALKEVKGFCISSTATDRLKNATDGQYSRWRHRRAENECAAQKNNVVSSIVPKYTRHLACATLLGLL